MGRSARASRLAVALWAGLAIAAWNAVYDLRISLGVRDYLLATALHEAARGPAVVMSEAMRATVRDAVLVASLWASIVLGVGYATVRLLTRNAEP